MKQPLRLGILAVMLAGLVIGARAQQASPQLIPFQGRLTNQQGGIYSNGQFTLVFNLYSQAVGGTPSWTERHQSVGVINGMVNVFLGSITSLTGQDFSTTKYLGITIDADNNPNTTDPEMVPRQMIIPSFWAKNSEKLAGQDWTAIFGTNSPLGTVSGTKITPGSITSNQLSSSVKETTIPIGTILAFGGTNAPDGFLMCDGVLRARSAFPALAAVLGSAFGGDINNFNVPDLRGRFLRGSDNMGGNPGAAGRDPDAGSRTAMGTGGSTGNKVGSIEPEDFKSHNHGGLTTDDGGIVINRPAEAFAGSITDGHALAGWLYYDWQPGGAHHQHVIPSQGGSETRPINAYVNYIIKY